MKSSIFISLFFLLALTLRFLYFPGNIYFGFDQARDAFTSLQLLSGHLKIVGPPSSFNSQLFHGPLIYYIYAPLLGFFSGNLEAVSFFLRVINSLGIFLVFIIGSVIFNKRVGILGALLFAVSFEQSQYALFLGHPALALLPVLGFYLGLSMLFFQKKWWGLLLALFSWGIAIEFHYVHVLLAIVLFILIALHYQNLKFLKLKQILISIGGFIVAVSPFLVSEIKYGFRLTSTILHGSSASFHFGYGGLILNKYVRDNFFPVSIFTLPVLLILVVTILIFLLQKGTQKKTIFLLLWLGGGIIPYLLTQSPSYYYGAGASVSLLILIAFLLDKIWNKFLWLSLVLVGLLAFYNISLQVNSNQKGPNLDMVIQPEMLIVDEKQIIDYIYQKADHQAFAVKALTVPFFVNTTWSYLFEWYGQKKYGYLPLWVGPNALGFPGNLKVIDARSNLPKQQFLIIEPTVGIREGMKEQFFEEEGYFTKILEEKQFGQFKVQFRQVY